jgi:hypothetical protein
VLSAAAASRSTSTRALEECVVCVKVLLVVCETMVSRCKAKTFVYGTKMGRYGSGMGLLASPTPFLRRGCCWTHPRPILTASMGQGWGQPHSRRRTGVGMGQAPSPSTLSMYRMGPCPTNPIPVQDGTVPIPVKFGHGPDGSHFALPHPGRALDKPYS